MLISQEQLKLLQGYKSMWIELIHSIQEDIYFLWQEAQEDGCVAPRHEENARMLLNTVFDETERRLKRGYPVSEDIWGAFDSRMLNKKNSEKLKEYLGEDKDD